MPMVADALLGSLAHHGSLQRLPTTFYDVKCHEGFKCVSAIDVFGRSHDGVYKGLPVGNLVGEKFRGVYEVGCPARGIVTPAGECRDQGKGAVKFCWSSNRFEAGPTSPCKEEADCICVKETPNGTGEGTAEGKTLKNMSADIAKGTEIQTKEYEVQPRADCETCASHNCDQATCNKCSNCEYGNRVVAGRMSKGCFDIDSGMARKKRQDSAEGRGYLFAGMDGVEATTKTEKLAVVPHDSIWDPGSRRDDGEYGSKAGHMAQLISFPYQNRSEPLSRGAWVSRYRKAAPQIQRLMDITAKSIKDIGPRASDIQCQWDVEGRVNKFATFRRSCQQMQSIITKLAPKTPFESAVDDGKGGFAETECQMGGQGMCENLNCYSDDVDVNKGLDQLLQRARICFKALKLLKEEEEVNGPIPLEGEETAKDGGRLEVPVPPPGEELPEETPAMSPVEAGLAILTAVGAGASAWQARAAPEGQSSCSGVGRRAWVLGRCRRQRKPPEAMRDFLCATVH
mmetsp:Transcript_115948/g.205271  ORF Transcript_115948/g.205271 Transcript_115948/m.205271 type:complete len:512 (-) Transcript_115948:116-1651(-)